MLGEIGIPTAPQDQLSELPHFRPSLLLALATTSSWAATSVQHSECLVNGVMSSEWCGYIELHSETCYGRSKSGGENGYLNTIKKKKLTLHYQGFITESYGAFGTEAWSFINNGAIHPFLQMDRLILYDG